MLSSPANEVHVRAGATFAPFAGWSMPISYGGVVAEHNAVREAVGIFDVSHLGKILVTGTGAAEYINSTLANDLQRISPGKAQYTLCCDESGGVIDDLIAYLVSESEVFLIPNAANSAEVARRLEASAPAGVSVQDQHRDHAVLAVQGPRSAELLELEGLPTSMPYMAFADAEWQGAGGSTVRICRTGYTGEQGYEIVVPSGDAEVALQRLADRAEQLGGRLAGLGARDTLRTEMGYPLHGHELSLEITPVEARCGWAVGWRKPGFWGRDALQRQREAGPSRSLWGLRALGRGVLRPGLDVLGAENEMIGTTTSGTFSPTLKTGIALALLDTSADITAGATVTVDVRGRHIPCEVVRPPFVAPRTQ
ncbi:glycine cleavage system aminomethyltransferase GcvT [Hoyosella sp. G463]|uniref:aminomethyltransferase n=1 Tax=Lolliginicoccus lacisalsi TaxID=2742202 RepID=A0A927JEM4_9ACTN|nr:glycine cleavage system aminomethyltransferase GcvT [Lolliginicoccus lacisalsi]MBD8507703.1 glycine cleavage system aminomethyltransferase GcvT [Lolliginicoccus lacisalsi]